MKLRSDTFLDRRAMPPRCAFGRHRFYPLDLDAAARFELSDNRNPHLAFDDVPEGARSLVLMLHDRDAPAALEGVNVAGRAVSRDAPRATFHHWTLIDLPPSVREITEGSVSEGVTARGKRARDVGPYGGRHGLNDYTEWFAADPTMKGEYFGYDGPCPPWNDELIHWYVFTLHALDVERLPIDDGFRAADVTRAMGQHVIASAELEGFYYINPEARFR